jgi:hypothetical protein
VVARDIRARGLGLRHPDRSYWPSVKYHVGLNRCLLVQAVPTAIARDASGSVDTRFAGGLAVFDAPDPWGPWTTARYAEHWDVAPGDSAGFPTKWSSADGRTLHLVFSGGDGFCVRRAEVLLRSEAPASW